MDCFGSLMFGYISQFQLLLRKIVIVFKKWKGANTFGPRYQIRCGALGVRPDAGGALGVRPGAGPSVSGPRCQTRCGAHRSAPLGRYGPVPLWVRATQPAQPVSAPLVTMFCALALVHALMQDLL